MKQGTGGYRLRVLHISDLHERGPRETESWRRRRVLGAAWERNLQVLLEEGPIDLVCFTGDAANFGLAEEYREATSFFTTLLQRLSLSRDRLFVVPGNHDIERGVEKDTWRALTEIAGHVPPIDLSRWMAGQAPPQGILPAWKEGILRRQGAYRAWVREGLGRPELSPEGSAHGRLGYRTTLTLRQVPFPVHVLGLDTSWLCGRDSEAGSLWLTQDQVMRLATDPAGMPLEGLRLVLLHHPLHELADGSHCRRLLADHADLLLRGHLHETEIETWSDPERNMRQVASGCLYEVGRADHCPNSFQIITLDLNSTGRPSAAEVRLRSWSPRNGHWFDDNSLYSKARNGRLTWTILPQAELSPVSNPFDPWTPVLPGQLAGRTAVLRRFETAAAEKRSVSLVGDRRIGKSSVLQTWADRARQQGRIVVELSGEGPEGLSISGFVSAVTSLPSEENADRAANVLARWAATVAPADQPPILLVDEVDGLVVRFEHRFFERLRGMLGKICLIFVSRRELDYIYKDLNRTSPFHNRLQLQWLGLLEPPEAEALIERSHRLLSPVDQEQMRVWAGRSPFYLQLLGWHLVEARLYGGALDDALEGFRTESAARLRELWYTLGERDRRTLRDAASGLPTADRKLRTRGLVTEAGRPFGKVLTAWLSEEMP